MVVKKGFVLNSSTFKSANFAKPSYYRPPSKEEYNRRRDDFILDTSMIHPVERVKKGSANWGMEIDKTGNVKKFINLKTGKSRDIMEYFSNDDNSHHGKTKEYTPKMLREAISEGKIYGFRKKSKK